MRYVIPAVFVIVAGIVMAVVVAQEPSGDPPPPDITADIEEARALYARGDVTGAMALVDSTANRTDISPELANTARVELLSMAWNTTSRSRIDEISQSISAEHAQGNATDAQLRSARLWRGKYLLDAGRYVEARGELAEAARLAGDSDHVVRRGAEFALGQLCEGEAKDAEEDRGEIQQQARRHYVAALIAAEAGSIGGDDYVDTVERVAFMMRHLDSVEKSLAWLRDAIADPSNMSEAELEIAELIGNYMKDAQTVWFEYLLNPARLPDPLNAEMMAEFERSAPGATSETVGQRPARLRLLAKQYRKEGYYDEAIAAYRQAATEATTPLEQARSLQGIPYAYKRKACSILPPRPRRSIPSEYMDLLADGLTVAEEAQQLWLQIIANGTQEEVYAASRACINGYLDVYKYSEAAASASWVLASLPPDVHPRTTAMVKRLQIYALGKAQQYDDIITLTQSFDSAFSASQDYQVLDEWATGLIFASAFCARAGSPEWGTYCLDQADSRYHEWRSDGFIAAESADHRAFVARFNQQQ